MTKQFSKISFLIACKEMSAENHITVVRLFNKICICGSQKGIMYDKVLLFISDAVSYMKKAAEALCVCYQKLIHLTCVVHALHSV